jgi:hypothetical protein
MPPAAGVWSPGIESKSFPLKNSVSLAELALLAGLGAVAVCLHGLSRGLVEMPGHQGLGWMALLVTGRRNSAFRWAAVASSMGAASMAMLPFWGFRDPFRWFTYLLAGATLDLLYAGLVAIRRSRMLVAIACGLAHMTKPLARVGIAHFNGWPYGSIRWGVIYPSASHFLFGFAGAMLAMGFAAAIERVGNRPEN